MVRDLDVDQPMGLVQPNGTVKITPYFEDALFESDSDTDDLLAILSSQYGLLQSRISELSRGDVKTVIFTATASITADTDIVFVSGSGNTFTLPAVGAYRHPVTIKNTDGSNAATIATPGSETIEGSATAALTAGVSLTLALDGANWFTI